MVPLFFAALPVVACGASDDALDEVEESFTVGGIVTGLQAGKSVILRSDLGEEVTVASDGPFTFATPAADGAVFTVSVATQPTGQTCEVERGSGVVFGADYAGVLVRCEGHRHTVGGTVSGLFGTVVLRNGDHIVEVGADGPWSFAEPVAPGSGYAVEVQEHPSTAAGGRRQTCAVANAKGTVGDGPITNVAVACITDEVSITVVVSGLPDGETVVLENNGDDTVTIPSPGSSSTLATFAKKIASGAAYDVTVKEQPVSYSCTVIDGTGTAADADVFVQVTCAENPCGQGGPCLVFTTSTTHAGNLGGLEGADAICQERADSASLGGTYKAWLSTTTSSPATRFTKSPGKYVRVDGVVIADDWDDLVGGSLRIALDRTEDGDLIANGEAWTGTTATGEPTTSGDKQLDCDGWMSAEPGASGTVGEVIRSNAYWTNSHADPCSALWRLYCFQQN